MKRLLLISLSLSLITSLARSQWTEPPGEGWVQISFYHQDTRQQFDEDGEVVRMLEDGHAVNSSLYITAAAGLFPGIDSWIQVPYHRLRFDDRAGNRLQYGVGEPKVYLRIGPGVAGIDSIPVALRGGVKFPRELDIDAEIIPLGEGQRDWELMLELGQSFYPIPMYAHAWIGYRWRETNESIDWKPGNEIFGFAAVGGNIGAFSWKMALEGLRGRAPQTFGLRLESNQRAFFQLLPKIGWRIGPGTAEIGAHIPVVGRNLPAGPSLVLGYFFAWE